MPSLVLDISSFSRSPPPPLFRLKCSATQNATFSLACSPPAYTFGWFFFPLLCGSSSSIVMGLPTFLCSRENSVYIRKNLPMYALKIPDFRSRMVCNALEVVESVGLTGLDYLGSMIFTRAPRFFNNGFFFGFFLVFSIVLFLWCIIITR